MSAGEVSDLLVGKISSPGEDNGFDIHQSNFSHLQEFVLVLAQGARMILSTRGVRVYRRASRGNMTDAERTEVYGG